MADTNDRRNGVENVIDLVGGAIVVLLGLVAAANGLWIVALILIGLGAWALIYGITKRQRASRPPQPPTT